MLIPQELQLSRSTERVSRKCKMRIKKLLFIRRLKKYLCSFALNDKVQEIDVAYEAGDKISSQINNLNN